MSKWRVYGKVYIGVCVDVDANTKDEAIEMAHGKFPGLTNFAGNGGSDKLVGVYDDDCHIDADYFEPEFTEAEPDA